MVMLAPNLTPLERRRRVDALGLQYARTGRLTPGQLAAAEGVRAAYNPNLYPESGAPALGYAGFSKAAAPDLRLADANSMRDSAVAMENARNPLSDQAKLAMGLNADMYGKMVLARGKPENFGGEVVAWGQSAPKFTGAPDLMQPAPVAPDLTQRAMETEFARRRAEENAMQAATDITMWAE